MAADKHEMGDLHEKFLAELNDGIKSKASGSQWTDQGDGRNNRLTQPFAFCWDGKSTCGQGITLTRTMIEKIREQAAGERPMFGLRWYASERLDEVAEDWVAIPADEWREVLESGREGVRVWAERINAEAKVPESGYDMLDSLGASHAVPLPLSPNPAPALPYVIPPRELWPCYMIECWNAPSPGEERRTRGFDIAADGRMAPFKVSGVRIEQDIAGTRLIVNEALVRRGELWIDGRLRVRVPADSHAPESTGPWTEQMSSS
jgi:hypothetical protein